MTAATKFPVHSYLDRLDRLRPYRRKWDGQLYYLSSTYRYTGSNQHAGPQLRYTGARVFPAGRHPPLSGSDLSSWD